MVLNIASIGGLSVETHLAIYNGTKAALMHLTRSLALEMAPGVRVNALAPGLVKTDMARVLWEPNEEAMARHTPLGRLGEPDDIANAARVPVLRRGVVDHRHHHRGRRRRPACTVADGGSRPVRLDPRPWRAPMTALEELARSMPDAWEDHPWDERVFKVNRQDLPVPGRSPTVRPTAPTWATRGAVDDGQAARVPRGGA